MTETNSHTPAARIVAFYLPQYYPTLENDRAWGSGFTEWTLVAGANPLFRGHQQPNLPGDLGFYDLRVPETRAAQADLARAHGVAAFCYWHYWFGDGRTALARPFDEVLASGEPDFPFCIGWANHPWTAKWRGAPEETLIEQRYPGSDDHRRHFDALLPAFTDPRYFTVDGAPVVHLFRPFEIPDLGGFVDLWRERAVRNGFPGLHVVGQSGLQSDLRAQGLDATVLVRGSALQTRPRPQRAWQRIRGPHIVEYSRAIEAWARADAALPDGFLPCLTTNWDDTPRYGRRGNVMRGTTPELFGRHVRSMLASLDDTSNPHRLVFLKSWNEWAEGNYLEPDRRLGRGLLEALARELGLRP